MCRCRSVADRPGHAAALTVMPSSAQRRVASTANRMLAVLDCPYASHGSYGRCSEVQVVEVDARAQVAARADRDHARAAGAARAGSSPVASAKWPRWLVRELQLPAVAVCSSRRRHHAGVVDQDVQRARPSRRERPRPSAGRPGRACRPGRRPGRCWRDVRSGRLAGARLRTAMVTSAPAAASARAVSTPMPEAAPVTTARRPVRSTPSTTSRAVESRLKGVVMRVMMSPSGGGGG